MPTDADRTALACACSHAEHRGRCTHRSCGCLAFRPAVPRTASSGQRVDVYPVGVLRELLRIRTAIDPRSARPRWHQPVTPLPGWRRKTVRHAVAGIRRQWRRRSSWNGYLAEPGWQHGWTRCGHGWTRRRALTDLARHLVEELS